MLVKSIERKIKINRLVSIFAIISSVVLVIGGWIYSYKSIEDARKSIYIIDNGIPVLVKQTDITLNRPVEYRAHVELFHRLFFTLIPDDKYIKDNIHKSLYLIDDTGKKEESALREKGFYNQIISSNSIVSIETDSINLDLEHKKFKYYGKQMINRKRSLILRKLITEGELKDLERSPNNAHGILIENWRILDNSEISVRRRY